MERDDYLGLRLPAEVKDALAKAAKVDDVSMSRLAARMISAALQRTGWLRKPDLPRRPAAR